jgi:hypothetical protein
MPSASVWIARRRLSLLSGLMKFQASMADSLSV